jgi:hypothetical protein
MKQISTRVAAPFTAALFALFLAGLIPNTASAGDYCRYDVTSHMLGCSYATLEQCQAMSAGRGGDCLRDPFLARPSDALAYLPKHTKGSKAATH